MTLEEIHAMWDEDSHIDRTNISSESLKTPKLHAKYERIFRQEALRLQKKQHDLAVLKKEKTEFFIHGETAETKARGWVRPRKLDTRELPLWLDADSEMIEESLKLAVQINKVELLKSILSEISRRGFVIKNHIDWERLIMGG